MGRDQSDDGRAEREKIFQSTRPAWGATRSAREPCRAPIDFNPRAPHGARPGTAGELYLGKLISIHAPRMGRDAQRLTTEADAMKFQSTRPAWGATNPAGDDGARGGHFNPRAPHGARLTVNVPVGVRKGISIHAPRMGRDLDKLEHIGIGLGFQSTRPAWGATYRP